MNKYEQYQSLVGKISAIVIEPCKLNSFFR